MADHSRLEDLRRRVEKDPASIAFAQLAEEYRRAGLLEQSVEVCRAGLRTHPGYLSARVTLGRALLELNQMPDAQHELEQVLHHAPENLAAIRGLAEIHQRLGHLPEALAQYRTALAIARNDPDLERTVEELAQKVAPQPRAEPPNGMSFDQIQTELASSAGAMARPAPPSTSSIRLEADVAAPCPEQAPPEPVAAPQDAGPAPDDTGDATRATTTDAPRYNPALRPADDRAHRTIAALTQWLDALNVARTDSHP